MKTNHQKMKELDEQKLKTRLKEIENSKNESSRVFRLIKEIYVKNQKYHSWLKLKQEDLPSTRKNRLKLLQLALKNSLLKTPKY